MDSRKKIPWLKSEAFDPDLLYEIADEIAPSPHFEDLSETANTRSISREYTADIDYDSLHDNMTIPG